MTIERLLTIPEAADALAVSVSTLRRFVAAGSLAHVRLGRTVRIDRRDLDRFVRERTSVAIDYSALV